METIKPPEATHQLDAALSVICTLWVIVIAAAAALACWPQG